ncbi:non-specific lipid-transfer protein 1-like [Euphorbia lathyris]|uniref:non-specific lipid-transfer protein 1-like n=1 Tax=Euphorbia lathyris TaxID=212925 RepID=UPI0033136CFF
MGINKLACVAMIVCLLVAASSSEAAITCGQVITQLQPCIGYLRTGGAVVPPSCCGGVKALNSQAKTTPDRQQVCNCVKSAAKSIPNLNFGYVSTISSKCGVNIPFKVGPNVNCATVK